MLLSIGEAVALSNDPGNENGLFVAVFSKCCCVYIEYYTCRGFAVGIKGCLLRRQYSSVAGLRISRRAFPWMLLVDVLKMRAVMQALSS